jgi:hypothetical protein
MTNINTRSFETAVPDRSGTSTSDTNQTNTTTQVTTTANVSNNQPAIVEQVLPAVQRELLIKYDSDLTKISNYSYVHKRDDAGNIVLQEDSNSNQLLTIEPVTYEFENNFVNKTINTRFSYFRFPATSVAGVDSPEFSALDQVVGTTLRELREQVAVGDVTNPLESDVPREIPGVTNPDAAANQLSTVLSNAGFNNIATVSRAIELAAGYDRNKK